VPVHLASYIRDLKGQTIVLPEVTHVPGTCTVLARRPGSEPDRVLVEALEFVATRVVRPINVEWPSGPFRIDRAEYENGELRFYRGDDFFGFGVDAAGQVTSSAADVDRADLEDGGIAGALSKYASGVSTIALDPQQAGAHERAGEEERLGDGAGPPSGGGAARATDDAASEILHSPGAWSRAWAPTPVSGVLFAVAGIALGYFAGTDLAAGDRLLAGAAAVVSAVLLVLGVLGILVPREALQRMMWSALNPHVPRWGLRLVSLTVGVALGAYGFMTAGHGIAAKAAQGGLEGLLLMFLAAVIVGYSITRLLPSAD
jgi:hypothetical protein